MQVDKSKPPLVNNVLTQVSYLSRNRPPFEATYPSLHTHFLSFEEVSVKIAEFASNAGQSIPE